jgi:hypothetical protein
MAATDRIQSLHNTNAVVGIDFVYVYPNQTTLLVFFHPAKTKNAQQILGTVQPAQIRIFSPSGGELLPVVPLDPATAPAWATIDGRRVLRVVAAVPGDFSRYRFRIDHPLIDPYFQEADFSFKANCPSLLDCAPPAHECPDESWVDYPVNYLARDFWSFRQALLDFASERHPEWQDRLEADFGVMLAELMSAMGDEFAWIQDRIAREASFENASQRRSLRRHARLVDYHVHDGLGASTWLDFTVTVDGTVHAGAQVWESVLRGVESDPQKRLRASRSIFEVGRGVASGHRLFLPPGDLYNLRFNANELSPYQWDADQTCLPVGSTFLHLQDHHAADLPLEDVSDPAVPVKWVVLRTRPADRAVAPRTWLVPLVRVVDEVDPLFASPITRIEWAPDFATPFEMEYASLVLRGNIVPATAGETLRERFQIQPLLAPANPVLPYPVERQGPLLNVSPADAAGQKITGQPQLNPALLFTLPGAEDRDLVWRGLSTDAAAPELRLFEQGPVGSTEWDWKRSFVGVNSSLSDDTHFMLDDGAWRRVAGYRRVDSTGTVQEFVHTDYASGRGMTIRFGDGDFGRTPDPTALFDVIYRLGKGRADNVAAGSLTDFDPAAIDPGNQGLVDEVTNPFDVVDAVAAQTAAEVRQVAPEAFRAVTFRAVRPEDYAEALERLEWVQRAGARFRWTGSWLTVFATPDPKGSFALTEKQEGELAAQLDRFRLAGREAWGRKPIFATIDLEIHVCVEPFAFVGDVVAAVLEVLFGRRGLHPLIGFFSPDQFTFGTPLDRSRLEAAIQAVPGVRAVETIRIRRRGWFDWRDFTETALSVGSNEIIRVENRPEFPERGAVRIVPHGGA